MRALILIDIQNDFLPGGSLTTPGADSILPIVQKLLLKKWDVVVATKDWHPEGHISFASRHQKKTGERIALDGDFQDLWPDHCVQGTQGAELHPLIKSAKIDIEVQKGTDCDIDSYSAFFDQKRKKKTELEKLLKEKKITDLYFVGLLTDWCVRVSVLDALELGFNAFVVTEGVFALNANQGDEERAIGEMMTAGAKFISIHDL